jgi:hypothetical protein
MIAVETEQLVMIVGGWFPSFGGMAAGTFSRDCRMQWILGHLSAMAGRTSGHHIGRQALVREPTVGAGSEATAMFRMAKTAISPHRLVNEPD